VVVLVPLALGWLRLQGQHLGLYGLEFGSALRTISMIAILLVVLWVSARSLNRIDEQRKQAQGELEKFRAEKKIQVVVGNRARRHGNCQRARPNGAGQCANGATFGYQRDEMLGRPIELLIPERFRPNHPSIATLILVIRAVGAWASAKNYLLVAKTAANFQPRSA